MPIYFPGCRILGLDIGSRAIKAVQLATSLKGFAITGFWVREHEASSWEELTGELRALAWEGARGDIICSSYPAHLCLFRTTEIPFADLDKIEATIRFEAEAIMAVPMEGMVVDYFFLGGREGKSEVLLTCCQEGPLNDYLTSLQGAELTPDTVDIDLFALSRLLEEMGEKRTLALLDCGAQKLSVLIVQGGRVRFVRSLPLAGGGGMRRLKGVLDEALLSMRAYEGKSGSEIEGVLLTGGGASTKGLADYLKKKGVKGVEHLAWVKSFSCRLPQGKLIEPLGGVAMGLALRGLKAEKGRVDLSRRVLGWRGAFSQQLLRRGKMLTLAAIIFALGVLANLFVGLWAQEHRYRVIKGEMRRIFKETFTEAGGRVTNELQQAQAMVNEMEQRGVRRSSNQPSGMLDLLREIAQRLPQGAKALEIDIDDRQVVIRGIAPSFAAVDGVKAGFAASPLFGDIKVSNVELGGRGDQGVTFQLVLGIKGR